MKSKNETKEDLAEIEKLSQRTEQRLKDKFEKVIDTPTDNKVKKYQDYETVLLTLYARELYKMLSDKINTYIDMGKTQAVQQLIKKGYEKKKLDPKVFATLKKAQKMAVKGSIQKVLASVKQNSRNNVLEMRNAIILQKKTLAQGFLGIFKKYGVSYFNDARGAKWSLDRYTQMMATSTLMSAQRQAFFETSIEYGNDLVKVIHLGISPECELCAPFRNKVLSITGNTKGYMSVADASVSGHLFSYNCDHTVTALELAPEKEEGDNKIALTEANIKYMKKNGLKNVKKRAYYEKPVDTDKKEK